MWTANTERFSAVEAGINDTKENLLVSIARGESEVCAVCVRENFPSGATDYSPVVHSERLRMPYRNRRTRSFLNIIFLLAIVFFFFKIPRRLSQTFVDLSQPSTCVFRPPVHICLYSTKIHTVLYIGLGTYKGVQYVCVCVCVFIYLCVCNKLHMTAQSGPVILVILCYSP